MTLIMYLQFILYMLGVFCLYMGGGLVVAFLVCKEETYTEYEHEREIWNREYKANEEHNRIGFLLKLRDERKEIK